MWTFFSVVAICLTVAYLARRAEPFLVQWVGQPFVSAQRNTEEATLEEVQITADPIPPDLVNVAMSESEDWAKQGVLKAMLDMYERCGNWDVVRAAYNPQPQQYS